MKILTKWIIIILSLTILIIGMGFYRNLFFNRGLDVRNIPRAKVAKGDFAIIISEVGQLEAKRSVYVTSNTQGQIISLIPEGSNVQRGDSIIWLDRSDIENQIEDMESSLKNAEQDVLKTEEQIRLTRFQNDMTVESARLSLENAQLDYSDATVRLARTERLFEALVIPESNLEDARLRVLAARANVEKAKLSMAQAQETRNSNLISSQIQLDQAKANLTETGRKYNELKKRLDETIITAPGDGIIVYEMQRRGADRSKLQEGDQVRQRMTLAQLPDLSSMITKVMVDEIDISRVKIGQEVRVKVEAIPNIELKGTITRIGTLAVDKGAVDAPFWMQQEEASGVKAFEVTADIEPNNYDLRPGMTTRTDIIIERFSDVMYVPRESVFEKGDKKVVYVLESQTAKEVEVQTGRGDNNFIIIEKGLEPGDIIALRNPTREIRTITVTPDGTESESSGPLLPVIPNTE